MMKSINSMIDFSYLSIGLRGSGCTRDEEDPNFKYPSTTSVYLSIQDPNGHAELNFGKSDDILELFFGKGGTSKVVVRRHLSTGAVVDLVYGYDLSVKAERGRWRIMCSGQSPKSSLWAHRALILDRFPSWTINVPVTHQVMNQRRTNNICCRNGMESTHSKQQPCRGKSTEK